MRALFSLRNSVLVTLSATVILAMNATAGNLVVEKAPTKTAPAAGKPAVVKGARVATVGGNIGDILREAYQDLERADHDYSGHRADAMHQIEAAAKLLGEKLGGDGKGGEKQGVSDEQLRAAQGLLEQARGGITGRPRVSKHINNAINQLGIALKLK